MMKYTESQRRNMKESFLNQMPKSGIPEIQEEIKHIHDFIMKDTVGVYTAQMYNSYISGIAGKLTSKLSRGYIELFGKDYSNYGLQEHNPYEHPNIAIERTQKRIERAWKLVQAKMKYFRDALESYKKQLLPIIESDLTGLHAESIKAIEKIPYDITYDSVNKEWITGPYYSFGSSAAKFCKFQFDKGLANILDEMCKYSENNMLLEIIPIIQKVYKITRKLCKLAEEKWKKDNSIDENSKSYKISMHNATGHINSGMGLYTFDILEKFKITNSSLLKHF
jgi:hypothetical protein